ncbi:chromosomal replication initiator protein DnaA [Candidatus Saccharibacteria bacterium]|nr:chromosomal replication initiator protein DnaA [Candidatus Saccharibacteria bacterium]MCB9821114.1 chromosomal replication initiator protein DnaA [Candidatus Nomurabacteria bacterium]
MLEGEALWQAVLGEIEVSVSRASFITWFKNTQLIRQSDDELVIGVPNIFAKQQLEQKFNELIEETLKKQGIESEEIVYKIHTPRDKSAEKEEDDSVQVSLVRESSSVPNTTSTVSSSHNYRQGLNSKYTFDSFVTGSSNELAYAACQAIAANPGTKYNPLFVYGGVGIGKTHLIQAVGNEVLRANPSAKVVYVTSEQFVQEFTDSIRFKKVGAFTQHYRSVDVLIVDDIQFIATKEKTQEEFFHTFNVLHQANKQVILSSDQPPHLIPTLEDRLRSRFQMGMAIDMQTPEFETRCAIIQTKAIGNNFNIGQECVEYLANSFTTNIRELEGALNQLMAFCDLRNVEPTLEVAKVVFAKLASRPKHISPKQIVERVAKYYRIQVEDIKGPKRDKDIVMPRQVAMYLLRSELKMSFPRIAGELGRKDHTTAIHSVDKINREASVDLILKQQLQEIREGLNA